MLRQLPPLSSLFPTPVVSVTALERPRQELHKPRESAALSESFRSSPGSLARIEASVVAATERGISANRAASRQGSNRVATYYRAHPMPIAFNAPRPRSARPARVIFYMHLI